MYTSFTCWQKHVCLPAEEVVFAINPRISCAYQWAALFQSFRLIWNVCHLTKDLFGAYMILKCLSRKTAEFRPQTLLILTKIAFHISIFGAWNQILKPPTTVLSFFSIPGLISIVKTRKLKEKFWAQKFKISRALAFLKFLGQTFLFEFLGYYNWHSSRDIKKQWKRYRLLHNLIERPWKANEKCDFRRMSWASFWVGLLPSSRMNILKSLFKITILKALNSSLKMWYSSQTKQKGSRELPLDLHSYSNVHRKKWPFQGNHMQRHKV